MASKHHFETKEESCWDRAAKPSSLANLAGVSDDLLITMWRKIIFPEVPVRRVVRSTGKQFNELAC